MEGNNITKELREYVYGRKGMGVSPLMCGTFTAIADRIDGIYEHELLVTHNNSWNDGYDKGFASADDWYAEHDEELAEHGWVRLPKDADGEYIHIGDRMEDNARVARIVLTDGSWEPSVYLETLPNVLHEYYCHQISHYHAPTVEDVLCEMLDAVDDDRYGQDRIIAEYAKRLKLAGDGE